MCLGNGTKQGGSTDKTVLFLGLIREVGELDWDNKECMPLSAGRDDISDVQNQYFNGIDHVGEIQPWFHVISNTGHDPCVQRFYFLILIKIQYECRYLLRHVHSGNGTNVHLAQ